MSVSPASTSRASTRSAKPAPTKWGDREGRTRDILDAARGQMQGGGYLGLNMRDIARGAGVSPGTLYQYFSTKEEIFATLYAEAIEDHTARLVPVCEHADDLEGFLVEVATAYLDLYAAYGRHFTTWSAVMSESTAAEAGDLSPMPSELSTRLRTATYDQAVLIVTTMRRIASGRGHRLVDEPQAMPMLWAVLNGLADHVTSERHKLTRFSIDELIAFAARTLAAGLVTRA